MTESPMLINRVEQYAGSKAKLAQTIIEAVGPHVAWWEPFCGGASVTLVKPPCRVEVLNDLNYDLTNLLKTVADRKLGPLLYRRLRRTMFSQQIHLEAQEKLSDETDPLERAYLHFIVSWMAWGGIAGTKRGGRKMSIRYTNNGGQQAKRYHSAVASIPAWRRRLRNVSILNMDAFALIPNIEDAPGTAIYIDAPYPDNSVDYLHEFPTLEQEQRARAAGDMSVKGHIALAELLNGFKRAKIVVSYYAHPMLDELYADWDRREIEVTKAIAQIAKRGTHRQAATEVLLVNDRGQQRGLFE